MLNLLMNRSIAFSALLAIASCLTEKDVDDIATAFEKVAAVLMPGR